MITGTGLRMTLRVKLEAKCLSTPLRRSPFYPLNYGGVRVDSRDWVVLGGDGVNGGVRWLFGCLIGSAGCCLDAVPC